MADDNTGEGDAEFLKYMQDNAIGGNDAVTTTPDSAPAGYSKSDLYGGANYGDYFQVASDTGAFPDSLKSLWSTGKDAFSGATGWIKDNKELSTMIGNGISSAMKAKQASESIDKQHAYDQLLWERRNQSIIGMKAPERGIIGQHFFDAQLARIGK